MRLPVYEQQVRLNGRNRTDLNVNASANAFGAQIGGAMQDLAAGVSSVAEAKAYKEALVSEADAKAGLNEYIDHNRSVLYDPQAGALTATGSNAMGESRKQAELSLGEKRKAIEERLGPQARRVFTDAADRLDDNSADALIKHDAAETRSYVNAQSQALTENFTAAAMDSYGDDAKWGEFMGAALGEIDRTGQLNGLPPEQIAAKKREALAAAHGNRAIRIAYDDPIKADAYIDSKREELGEAEYTRLKTGMEAAVVDRKAETAVNELRGSDAYVGKKGGGDDTWLRYANQGKIRDKPISPGLKSSMSFLRDMGITMEVFSGGQDAKGEGTQRTGSTRHDHGEAADVSFYKDGRRLDWNDPKDQPYFKEIVARAKASGVTGFGAGDGYMQQGSMHIGFGNPGVWGAEGSGSAAAPWLVEAYAGAALGQADGTAPAPSAQDEGMTTRSAYEAVMRIEDPKVRAAAMAKLDGQLKLEERLATDDQQAALGEAWNMVTQQGVEYSKIPMDLQIKMGREATLTFFESARAYESGTLVTDELRYSELQRMAVDDPSAFLSMNLNEERLNFSKNDFRAVEQMQLELKQQIEGATAGSRSAIDDPAAMKSVYGAAEQVYNDVVPSKEGRRSQEEAASYNRFQQQVKSYARDFMQEKGRPMTFDEQDRLFSMLLTPTVIEDNSGVFGSSREAMMFDAPFREPGERVRGNVPASDIAMVDEEEARQELLQFYGREPTEDEITVHHNRKLLADMGVSPEMGYSEVPRDVRRKMAERYPDASDEELVDLYIDFVLETAKRQ
jgi:hypothetical protein